ncbi:MAG: FeoA family protein [Bacteroidia bacterium]
MYFCFRSMTKEKKTKELKNLSQLEIGQSAIIDSFTDKIMALKLLEMGCTPGEIVKLDRIAPMGDPIAILVSGYLLSLRKSEASTILVSPIVVKK